MSANCALHPQSDVDSLYLPRKMGSRGLVQVKQTVEEEKRALGEYINFSNEAALKKVAKEKVFEETATKKQFKEEQMNSLPAASDSTTSY